MLFLLGILTTWIFLELRSKSKKYEPPQRKVVRCTICAHLYIADKDEAMMKCPRCGNLQDSDK